MTTIVFGQGAAGSEAWPVELANGVAAVDALTATAYALGSGAFSGTTALTDDYILNKITFQFTTALSKRITVSRADGSVIYDKTTSALEVQLTEIDEAYDGGQNITVAVTQTSGVCAMDMKLTVLFGSTPVGGAAVVAVSSLPSLPAGGNVIGSLGAGSSNIGKVDPGHVFPVRQVNNLHTLAGRRFIATTGYVQCTQGNSNEKIAFARNPSGSGVVVVLDQAEFGATNDCRFSRYGGGTISLVGTPTPRPVGRSDGASSGQTPKLEIYTGGTSGAQFNIDVAGTLRKVATMRSYATYQILQISGTAVIQPGGVAYWLTDEAPGGGAGAYQTFIDFEWYEIDTTTWANMIAEAAAFPLF